MNLLKCLASTRKDTVMKHRIAFAVGSVLILAGCSSVPIVLEPVGPSSSGVASSTRDGELQVCTETEEYNDGDVIRNQHTDYQICTPEGKRFKRVWNALPGGDEFPAEVTLPPGNYFVKAQADFYGPVTVPVVIKTNQVTQVVLQPGWKPEGHFDEADLVRFPKGYFVGWQVDLPDKSTH